MANEQKKCKIVKQNNISYAKYNSDFFQILDQRAFDKSFGHFLLGEINISGVIKKYALNYVPTNFNLISSPKKKRIFPCDAPNGATQTDDKPPSSPVTTSTDPEWFVIYCSDDREIDELYLITGTTRAAIMTTFHLNCGNWDMIMLNQKPLNSYVEINNITGIKKDVWK